MRRFAPALAALLLLPTSAIAAADSGALGAWRVNGSVSGHDFALDCRFEPAGSGFDGVCTEIAAGSMGHPGKVHKLTRGTVSGNRLVWAYPVSALFTTFDMTFDGTLAGNHISGSASAAGRKGTFKAER